MTTTPEAISATAQKVYLDWLNTPQAGFDKALERAVEAGVRLSAQRRAIGLTAKQHDLLTYIQSYVQAKGIPPSYDEMKLAVGLKSRSGIHRLIIGLEERGAIVRMAGHARAIEVVRAA